jgi:hypothetical protein
VTGARIDYTPDPAMSYWPTPPDVADDLVHGVMEPWHGDGTGVRVLEPSAGDGHLVRAIRDRLPGAHIVAVEPDPGRAATLRALPGLADEVIQSTLEDYLTDVAFEAFTADGWPPFDLAIANPPYTLPGRPEAWAEHFLQLYNDPHLLRPGAVVTAVVPRIVLTGQSKLVWAVRGLLQPHYGAEPCEPGAFAPVGAALIRAYKPHSEEATW